MGDTDPSSDTALRDVQSGIFSKGILGDEAALPELVCKLAFDSTSPD
jgi:hypothetical protein